MRILGVHGGYSRFGDGNNAPRAGHDSTAVLVEDGEVIAAVEEERLDRVKHSNYFPERAIRACLDAAGIALPDVDVIALNERARRGDEDARGRFLRTSTGEREKRAFVSRLYEDCFGVDVRKKLRFCDHHFAHAWSAFGMSGMRRALVLVLDGNGDEGSGAVLAGDARGRRPRLTLLTRIGLGQSLGFFYKFLIHHIGFRRFDEYKAMGLAPYGDAARYRGIFERGFTLLPDGQYRILDHTEWRELFDTQGLGQVLERADRFSQPHRDFAAALQQTLERIVWHILDHHQRVTGLTELCVAGGVGQNCTLNGKLLYSKRFTRTFFLPVPHDAGGALGAALAVGYALPKPVRPTPLRHLYLGPELPTPARIAALLGPWGAAIRFRRREDIVERTADVLAKGAVIGWVQGRSEFGPRALGNRSIVADPRPASNKERINAMIKKREGFRPFAPSILEEFAPEVLDLPHPTMARHPFMISVLEVKRAQRKLLGAVTHVNGTARVQTVSRDDNPRYWSLIDAFCRRTGVPLLLNTSFNNNAEPIVDSVQDAIVCFLTTTLDHLVIGDFFIDRGPRRARDLAIEDFEIRLPADRALVEVTVERKGSKHTKWWIESASEPDMVQRSIEISEEAYALLARADGKRTIGRLLPRGAGRRRVANELHALWAKRAVVITPRE